MSDSPVIDWEAIVHKNVRSKDMADVGYILIIRCLGD